MKTGLCSITFRQFDISRIVDLSRDAGLDAIEWGGDVHVPPGNTATADKARELTASAGLEVSSYGSYYQIIDAQGAEQDFAPVLESTLALGTDTIRIWPGTMPSDVMPAALRRQLVAKLRADLDRAAEQGIRLALEFHINSLCDSNSAALAFLEEVDHPGLHVYWQPIYWLADVPYRRAGLEALAGRTLNVHVFHWLFHPNRGTWGKTWKSSRLLPARPSGGNTSPSPCRRANITPCSNSSARTAQNNFEPTRPCCGDGWEPGAINS